MFVSVGRAGGNRANASENLADERRERCITRLAHNF